MKLFKRLFCRHDWKYERSFIETVKGGDSGESAYITWQEKYDVYKCKKCGKIRKRFIDYLD